MKSRRFKFYANLIGITILLLLLGLLIYGIVVGNLAIIIFSLILIYISGGIVAEI